MNLIKKDELFEKYIAMPIAWNSYLLIALEFLVLFAILTTVMGDYFFFAHQDQSWTMGDFILAALYMIIIALSFARMIKKLPMAAIMLAAPTVPLIMLILTVTSLALLHLIHKKPAPPPITIREPKIEVPSTIKNHVTEK